MIKNISQRLKSQLLAQFEQVILPRDTTQALFFILFFFLYPADRLLSVYIELFGLPNTCHLLLAPLVIFCVLAGFLWLYTLELERAHQRLKITLPRGLAQALIRMTLVLKISPAGSKQPDSCKQ